MSKLRWLLLLVAVGCASPQPVTVEPIVDGTPAPDEEAIVSVIAVGFCSGTLISRRVVLTAKHCVVAEGAPGPVEASSARVGIGPEWFSTRASYRVEEILTTPGPLNISSIGNPVTGATGTDVALLVLTEPVLDVTPIPVHRADPTPLVGTTATAIGYGRTRTTSGGEKQTVDTVITDVTPVLIEAVETICQGDSGGPLLTGTGAAREVVGVASFGVFLSSPGGEAPCPAEHDYWNRVDVQMELIDRALVRSGTCVESVDETCNSLDDDCDGTVDETCAALGEACGADTDCAFAPLPSELAGSFDGTSVRCVEGSCALRCDVLSPRTECTSIEQPFRGDSVALDGWVCGSANGCEGVCVRDGDERRGEGEACTSDGECASARCEDGACRVPCAGDHGSCPSGEVCLADEGQCGVCGASEERPMGRGRGEPCETASECASGMCTGGLCTLACTRAPECGEGFRCAVDHCVPGELGALGDPCVDRTDCGSGAHCVSRDGAMSGGARFCARTCPATASCVVGTTCVMIDESSYCAPEEAVPEEACTTDDECLRGECVAGACRAPCGIEGESCPAGLFCYRVDETSDASEPAYCAPPPPPAVIAPVAGCACHVGAGSRSGVSFLRLALGLGLGLVLLARRRTR